MFIHSIVRNEILTSLIFSLLLGFLAAVTCSFVCPNDRVFFPQQIMCFAKRNPNNKIAFVLPSFSTVNVLVLFLFLKTYSKLLWIVCWVLLFRWADSRGCCVSVLLLHTEKISCYIVSPCMCIFNCCLLLFLHHLPDASPPVALLLLSFTLALYFIPDL